MIPLYFAKWLEESARGIFVAVGGYIVGAIVAGQLQPTRESVAAAIPGLITVAWAALRQVLNTTPLTPPQGGA